ncbi:MAG: winged helix-turn-helix transcriptional regulator, partial [Sphingomonas sp.]|nr:winged helix-turn-helix transcriptional regulator [Sphingomonas sp.]
DMTSIELSTMSRLISTMVGRGLVTRERLPNNDRTVSIDLTPEGRRLAAILIKEAQHYEDVAVSHFSEGDVERLKSLLREVYAATDILEGELSASAPSEA